MFVLFALCEICKEKECPKASQVGAIQLMPFLAEWATVIDQSQEIFMRCHQGDRPVPWNRHEASSR